VQRGFQRRTQTSLLVASWLGGLAARSRGWRHPISSGCRRVQHLQITSGDVGVAPEVPRMQPALLLGRVYLMNAHFSWSLKQSSSAERAQFPAPQALFSARLCCSAEKAHHFKPLSHPVQTSRDVAPKGSPRRRRFREQDGQG
jgi:hypothetical protein